MRTLLLVSFLMLASQCQPSPPGLSEFGLPEAELSDRIRETEALIAECMAQAGFDYVPVDEMAVRTAMNADKTEPGMSEEEYAAARGYGISTLDMDVRIIGLGENLHALDAYNDMLLGRGITLAYALEAEMLWRTDGCTRTAVEQTFDAAELEDDYRNPGDALLEKDRRVVDAYRDWSACMARAGFDYEDPEKTEPDFWTRLAAVTTDGELHALQDEERAVAVADLHCEREHVEPVLDRVETEVYATPQRD